ncbi:MULTISPECIES: hypothetical protein [Halobacteriales]|uniref:Uncharacterized protein n=2 Tax=Halobacteriales TaxID=2235 RepID=A0A1I0QYW8_9EURY|nr:hypothetical protein [Natrinema salifodinae]SEW32842.1 hypothetical protein SAMN05216285_4156 [Natrinema salifodinae]
MSVQENIEQQRAAALEDSPYRRDSWVGEDETDRPRGHDPAEFDYHAERAAHVAHQYLKETSQRLLCPITLNADPGADESIHDANHAVELSEPEVHLPLQTSEEYGGKPLEYGQNPNRVRYNPEYGYIVGPQIPDRPTPQFMSVLDDLLEHWRDELDLRDGEVDKLRRDGHRLKQTGERDVTIVATLVEDVTSDEPLIE